MPKLISDALVINWMLAIELRQRLISFLVAFAFFPSMLFFTRFLLPEDAVPGPRLVGGSIVFALGNGVVGGLVGVIAWWRFSRKQDLFVTAPVHQLSYAGGLISFQCIKAVLTILPILALAPLASIELALSPWFPLAVLLTSLSLAGLALLIGTYAPTWESANMLSNLVGFLLLFISPVYFPLSRLPDWLEWPARFSPYTHAANALTATLSGADGFADDLSILAAITAVGLFLGSMGMRWREV